MAQIFKPEHNCWQTGKIDKAALLIDCANYYRALYYALCNAKHSIFILGWDIDGRIALLRGDEAKNKKIPVGLFKLIQYKAKQNPDLQIYLNRWNYSIFFAREREAFSGWKWSARTPSNVHYCADYNLPFSACHHQKIIVIDDEIAFCGGMDIALGRWDHRQHHVKVKERVNPSGILPPFQESHYDPYHDIQIMVTGPIVSGMSQLVRNRWEKGAGFSAIPIATSKKPNSRIWPAYIKPDFENIRVAIARTIPKTREEPTIHEILNMYLDEISRAEKFIYIENQYATCEKIAHAINRRLKERPELHVLIVSCDHPRGFMEHKAMWTGRVDFCDIAREDIDASRFTVAYPVSWENSIEKTIHIHSKLMIVDDKFLHIGSSNLNNRSMGFDTECDVIIGGNNEKVRRRISSIRNNLLREHTGRTEEDIADILDLSSPLTPLLKYQKHSRQHLRIINNEPYRKEIFKTLAKKIGDPQEAYLLVNLPVRQILFYMFVLALFVTAFWAWLNPVFSEFFSQQNIADTINQAKNSPWNILWIAGIYVVAGAVFFPVTVLNLTTAIVFGPFYGILMALSGSVSSACASYTVGRIAGERMLQFFKPLVEKIRHYTQRGGILGMTLVRLVPLAPFTLVNLTFGISRVPFGSYVLATIFGLLPGIFAKALFGGALGELWENPEPRVIFYIVGSLLLWIGIIWASHRVFKHYKLEMG